MARAPTIAEKRIVERVPICLQEACDERCHGHG
jgi:hypothetical protein